MQYCQPIPGIPGCVERLHGMQEVRGSNPLGSNR